MSADVGGAARLATVRVLGRKYRLRGDADSPHLDAAAAQVDELLLKLGPTPPDTQNAAVLAALNLASDLLRLRAAERSAGRRIRALVELVDSV